MDNILYLPKDESFSMSAYVTSVGEQSIVLRGYLVDHRPDGTYIAPLLPEMFYGADGHQLIGSWRQNLTVTGDQLVLSRSGGLPTLPRQEIGWRKISENHVTKQEVKTTVETKTVKVAPSWLIPVAIVSFIFGGYILYKVLK